MSSIDDLRKYSQKLTKTLRRSGTTQPDAEDAVQEAYVRMLDYIAQGRLVSRPKAFWKQAARNALIDSLRRQRKHSSDQPAADELDCQQDPAANPEQEAAQEQLIEHTIKLLDESCGERARKAFFLNRIMGLNYDRIAEELNVSVATIERDMAKAIYAISIQHKPRE